LTAFDDQPCVDSVQRGRPALALIVALLCRTCGFLVAAVENGPGIIVELPGDKALTAEEHGDYVDLLSKYRPTSIPSQPRTRADGVRRYRDRVTSCPTLSAMA
jgi:hypothetical protein